MSRTILAHEWLEPTGGSENTFAEMVSALPDARIECLWNNAATRFPNAHESFLARTPTRDRKALSMAFMRRAWNQVDLTGVDRVIASSHAMSHHLAGRAAQAGLTAHAYVYSPARYVWTPSLDARGQSGMARVARPLFKEMDRRGLHPDVNYIAISKYVAERMRKTWRVDASVIYPPVNTEGISSVAKWADRLEGRETEIIDSLPSTFILGASRLIEYKRLDAVIAVGQELGLPVVIAGSGPFAGTLKAIGDASPVPVQFVGRLSDAALYALYQKTTLFVFMAIEDFGIMPIEAMSLGTPTLVRDQGGAREVADLVGGVVFANPDHRRELKSAAEAAIGRDVPPADRIRGLFSRAKFQSDLLDALRSGS